MSESKGEGESESEEEGEGEGQNDSMTEAQSGSKRYSFELLRRSLGKFVKALQVASNELA